ncbi:hypothetical protein ACLOJK_034351 [Asimina triloba]
MAEEQLIMPEDLDAIREGYGIPASIALSAPALQETSRDHRLRYLCSNEHILRVGVRIPFEFGVAEALWAFHVSPAHVVPHSWNIIQAMAWFCERRGCLADRYLWRELLICRSLHGYAMFLTRDDVKAIDNPPVLAPGWESRFFFARLSVEGDIWGIPEQWENPFLTQSLDPVDSYVLSGDSPLLAPVERGILPLMQVQKGKKCALKRARPSKEGSILVDSDSSVEDASDLSPTGGSPAAANHVDHRRASLPQESVIWSRSKGMVPSSDVTLLREELEASRAEVACLQSLLRGDSVRSSAMVEYLQSVAYRRRVEFERAHHSQSGMSELYRLSSMSQQGRPFGGNLMRAVPTVVLKEMCC